MLPCSTNWRCPWRPIPHRPPNPRPVRSLWMTRWPSCWASFPSIRGRKRGQNPRQKKRPETRPQCHLPTADLPSIVSVNLLAALMAFLRLDRKCSDRPCVKPLERNRLAGFFAIAICSFIKALQRRIDLGDQLALAIPRPQFDSTIGLRRSPVGQIRMVGVFLLKKFQRLARFTQYVVFPGEQLLAEVGFLPLVHERLVFGGYVVGGNRIVHATHPNNPKIGAYIFAAQGPHKLNRQSGHAFVKRGERPKGLFLCAFMMVTPISPPRCTKECSVSKSARTAGGTGRW